MARNGDPRRGDDTGTHIITKTRPKTKRPSLYKVLLLNDDYTPMDFVVYVLARFFTKPPEGATRIILHVHQKGVGICGVYTYEVAETKVAQVTSFARQHEHPLQCTMEKEGGLKWLRFRLVSSRLSGAPCNMPTSAAMNMRLWSICSSP